MSILARGPIDKEPSGGRTTAVYPVEVVAC